ncbi:MAG TPA: nitroreductase [Clostridiales bacterium]|nr:nitroreductase [Clostridiales bacterium]
MTVFSAIQQRRSIRHYQDLPVEEDKILQVLEAARLAPSANNRQSWKFIVVRDPGLRARLVAESIDQPFVGEAPVILAACGTEPDGVMACGQSRYTVDLSIATAFMVLEAWELGLGTCWLGHFDEPKAKEILQIPAEVRIVAMTPLGYPTRVPSQRPRKALAEIACYDLYQA